MRDSLPVTGVMPGDPDIAPGSGSIWEPCGACGGSGFAHCCEGEQAQPGD
jgi:hypothetical protein